MTGLTRGAGFEGADYITLSSRFVGMRSENCARMLPDSPKTLLGFQGVLFSRKPGGLG